MKLRVIGTGPWSQVYRSLLPEPECPDGVFPDAVIVANKSHVHHSEAIRWLRWRVPVLVEKPFAMTTAQCEEMIACAEEHGTYLAAAHVLKFDRRFELLKPLVTNYVKIIWTDPTNGRYDATVPIETDVLPHIVSVIDTLCPGEEIVCDGVSYGGRGRDIRLQAGKTTFDVHLERDSWQRQRLINTGTRTLNFAQLPHDHNPLRELIAAFCEDISAADLWPSAWSMDELLSTDLALSACRVTEDVLSCVERFRPSVEAYAGP